MEPQRRSELWKGKGERDEETGEKGRGCRGERVVVVGGWLFNFLATCKVYLGTDLLRQLYLLPN